VEALAGGEDAEGDAVAVAAESEDESDGEEGSEWRSMKL
jgi:hypothetical protein